MKTLKTRSRVKKGEKERKKRKNFGIWNSFAEGFDSKCEAWDSKMVNGSCVKIGRAHV